MADAKRIAVTAEQLTSFVYAYNGGYKCQGFFTARSVVATAITLLLTMIGTA